jgi:CRP-like cAMP-binding protein
MLKDFTKGETIISSSHQGREIHFIADGSVDVKRASAGGKEVIISRLGVGNFISEIALLTALQRTADVVAVEDCIMTVLGAEAFNDLFDQSSRVVRALLVDLANRVAVASTRSSDLALLGVDARVYRALRGLAVDRPPHLVVSERSTHRDLAAMVGTSREMVTRALSRLEDDGVIRVGGGSSSCCRELPNNGGRSSRTGNGPDIRVSRRGSVLGKVISNARRSYYLNFARRLSQPELGQESAVSYLASTAQR